ncbi:MAG: AAA family ATPase, partial [Planctomycetaceae bacterium]
RIQRPTIVAGGELTMEELEVRLNPTSRICEASLQIKSNCGVLVIDDFGRQRIPVSDLLNRWIVPLEKRIDYLGLPTGKKIGVPFEQLLVFSTNLEPRDLVDAAFLRRIPYKIEIPGPTKEQFRKLLHATAMSLDLQLDEDVAGYLIERHFVTESRPMRFCHPRDLLLQSRSHCEFHQLPMIVTAEAIDIAVENYCAIT